MNKRFLKQVTPLLISLAIVGGLSYMVRRVAEDTPQPFERLIVEVLPEIPDLDGWPREFVDRLHDAHGKLAEKETQLAALEDLAKLYHANGFVSQAQSCYLGLEGADPENPVWPYLLAALKDDFDDKSEVIHYLNRSLHLDPTNALAYLRLGNAYVAAGFFEEAKRAYDLRLTAKPNDAWTLVGLGKVAIAEGSWEQARDALENAIANDSRIGPAYDLLPEVYLEIGDVEAAKRVRQAGADLVLKDEFADPSLDFVPDYCYDPLRFIGWAREKRRLGDLQSAVSFLERALELHPDDPDARAELEGIAEALSGESTQ